MTIEITYEINFTVSWCKMKTLMKTERYHDDEWW